ncbi:XRE family transcriptional regulator [Halobellus ruber]|uniref:DNA helicase n=1 Tax=Halobellus ruber TaxID=2761102 RepID=A0A7J9SKK1_9EURY|nr:XRE family transcriptional regulator [Halobellus ruber]MBB6647455.1 XRE family transcriptional regulator [Halobellus ruber]
MAQAPQDPSDVTDRFIQFYRKYYRNEIGTLAQKYPNEQRSLYIAYDDLSTFDMELAEDYLAKPDQMQEYAEEALRLYDLPADVKLGRAHVRLTGLPETVDIRNIRVHDDHIGRLIAVQGIVRKATDVRPKITEAAFECQRCGTMTYIPQSDSGFQEPHECQGCERQGPFHVDFDQSEFVDAQKVRVQESPEGLRGGETPQNIDVDLEDDVTGQVTAGDHVTVTGVLHIEQQTSNNEKTPIFDLYMDGVAVEIEDEEFEDMNITEEDVAEIVDLSNEPNIHEKMVDSVAPSIYGYREEKLAMILQLFSGVTKHLPDGSRIRGDLHMLLIGDPGTGKCVAGDTRVTLADGSEVPIRELVEENLDEPKPVDDGVWDTVDLEVPSMESDGSLTTQRATKVWKREAPDKLYRIRTASGTEIEVTPSHPLFVVDSGPPNAVIADDLEVGQSVAVSPMSVKNARPETATSDPAEAVADGGVSTDRIVSIEPCQPDDGWVYDLEVAGTHSYLSNNLVSHNSAMLQYIRNIAPRSVYTSGKGSSSAGLTAAAVRDDFGDGQQWTLEAGALVLADKGIAAVDELDKMRCVTGDTLVTLGDGSRSRIEALATAAEAEGAVEELPNGRTIRGVDIDVWTMTDDERLVRRPVTAVHEYDAPETLYTVTLSDGAELTATADHPFFIVEDDKRIERPAEALAPGDEVYVPIDDRPVSADGGVRPDSASTMSDTATAGSRDPVEQDVTTRTVDSVRRVASDTDARLYDLTVQGTHNFVANGMIVHNSEDRSAMHEALEQQSISVSKAGINATLKSRCSLLGAANPKYGRFDQYEPIGEQIDLEPALISRFDLIFTVTDSPDPEEDAKLADHIINTNYAGELHTQRTHVPNSEFTDEEVDAATAEVTPEIEAELLRKYIAYAKRNCYPTMTEEAKEVIRQFYVDFRAKGADEDAPVPVTARKLEALVRLSEASARLRLSDTVERDDAVRVTEIVESCLRDIGMDPETGEFDADIVETGTSKTQRDRIKDLKHLIEELEDEYDEGAPVSEVVSRAGEELGLEESKAEKEIEKLKRKGELYEPRSEYLRTT